MRDGKNSGRNPRPAREIKEAEIELKIEKLVPGGLGLSRFEGKIVFVPGALPGERVLVSARESGKGFDRARLQKVIEASPDRVEPGCPVYGICGACESQYVSAAGQRSLKLAMLRDALARQGGLDASSLDALLIESDSGPEWNYRGRMQFHRGASGPGLRRRGDHSVVSLQSCPVAKTEINEWLASKPAFESDTEDAQDEGGTSMQDSAKPMKVFAADGKIAFNADEFSLRVKDKTIRFSVSSFFQSNVAALERLIEWMLEGIPEAPKPGSRALDLYCGCGVFSVFLAERFESLVAIDIDNASVDYARVNLEGTIASVHTGDLDKWAEEYSEDWDLVVVDPPRNGLSASTRAFLCEASIRTLVYVSCDGVTFARDLKVLLEKGWKISRMRLFDFYPQTWHMEVACILQRTGS